MTTFTEPAPIGNAYGPGHDVTTCHTCGALVLPEWTDVHATWHEEQS